MTAAVKGPDYFGRAWNVQIDTAQTNVLRVAFSVIKTHTKEPNKASVSIYNLAAETRNRLRKQNVFINVSAGYQNTSALLFSGYVRAIEHLRDKTEWITKVTSGDGELPIRTTRASKSWRPKTLIATVITDLATATTLPLGNIPAVCAAQDWRKGVTMFARGYTSQGGAYDELVKLAFSLGYEVSVQDGALQMIKIDGANSLPVLLLSQQSGLVGSPQVAETFFVKCTSLLNGAYTPGRRVHLKSDKYDGLFVVKAVEHKGDSHGQDWFSNLTLQGLKQ